MTGVYYVLYYRKTIASSENGLHLLLDNFMALYLMLWMDGSCWL